MIKLQNLLDDVKCYETVRQSQWPDGVRCPHCGAATITKQGRDTTQPARRKYRCERCHRYFDDLTGTVLAGHHQPLQVWVLCLYFMGLNLSIVKPLNFRSAIEEWRSLLRHDLQYRFAKESGGACA